MYPCRPRKAPGRAPVFRVKGGIRYVQAGHSVELEINARSNRGAVIYCSAANLPAGAHYNAADGRFVWTPTKDQLGQYTVTFFAQDGLYTTRQDFTFIVSDYF